MGRYNEKDKIQANKRSRERYATDPEYRQRRKRFPTEEQQQKSIPKRKYGITPEDYCKKLQSPNGVCAIETRGTVMNTVTLTILFLPAFGLVQNGSDTQPAADKRPTKVWTRVGPLGPTPKHVSDAYPLSDQQNKAGWVKFEPMSYEFEGKELDRSKWTVGMSWWKGRQPCSPTRTSRSRTASCI
jgi:hypothetical protein